MIDLPLLRVAYISQRPFFDGPVTAPFPENDPANIAYVLRGDYFSFYSLKRINLQRLEEKLSAYDLVFVALDHRALDTVAHISSACGGRLATYSEGNVADYQMHTPAGHAKFLQILNQACINFIYWEKYVPFYQALTDSPVEYLPYPYFYEEAADHAVPVTKRARQITLPSGLTGRTRNGLGSLAVARLLLRQGSIEQVNCWLSANSFSEDARVIQQFLFGTATPPGETRFKWRQWLKKSGLDYRILLKAKKIWRRTRGSKPEPPLVQTHQLALYRRRAWDRYLPEMAKTMLIIDMNTRETVGRNAQDGAAVGVPCLSTDRSDMQIRLFPDITLNDSWDVQEAVALSRRLLEDELFFQAVIERAAREIARFGPEAFRVRFAAMLTEHPQLVRS